MKSEIKEFSGVEKYCMACGGTHENAACVRAEAIISAFRSDPFYNLHISEPRFVDDLSPIIRAAGVLELRRLQTEFLAEKAAAQKTEWQLLNEYSERVLDVVQRTRKERA
ncbi:MAG: hypothetical protein AAB473_03100 [Patescibacteria group bacterium]